MSASVSTRSTWVDDSGTGLTGTIINNAELQKIYDAIDLMFSGTGAYATAEYGANLKVDGNLTVLGTITNPSAPLTLLKQGSGTSTAAGATTVDTVAISGLTAKDSLVIEFSVESATQDTALTYLRNETDTVIIGHLCTGGGVVTAGATFYGDAKIAARQGTLTGIVSQVRGFNSLAIAAADDGRRSTFVTNWSGAWTLGLRHNGVTAGGTFSYTWKVFKLAGQ